MILMSYFTPYIIKINEDAIRINKERESIGKCKVQFFSLSDVRLLEIALYRVEIIVFKVRWENRSSDFHKL